MCYTVSPDKVMWTILIYGLKLSDAVLYISAPLDAKNNQIRFEVNDEGRGIPTEELNMIWERYHKTARDGDIDAGTGLGLAIVKGILELHGAEFGVESEYGFGSTFWFKIAEA